MKTKIISLLTLIIFGLNFVVFTPALAIIINGIPQDSTSVSNPNQYYTNTTTGTTGNSGTVSVTAGAGATTYTNGPSLIPSYTNGRWSEDTLRNYFNSYGVGINSGNLYGLGNFAVTGAVSLKKTVDYFTNTVQGCSVPLTNLNVIAGTEIYGPDQPVLDIADDSNLDYFINHMATSRGTTSSGPLFQLGDDYFYNTNGHWHIIFGPSNGAFVKNLINFFGMVRDNFNVQHPMITDSNTPSSVNFSRNLTIGSSGQDVKQLQQLLNTDPYTQIAQSGAGSPGNETTHYGSLTKAAVSRYQYKYNEILDAAGITSPTGFTGPFTRASMTAYFNYIQALKTGSNRDTLQYPTPTKPQQDVSLTAGSAPCGTTSSGNASSSQPTSNSPIVVNTTPTAPNYPGFDTDPLNNTAGFFQPGPTYTQDPANSNNVSDIAATPQNQNQNGQQQQQQSPLSQLGSILGILALTRATSPGGLGGTSGLGGNTGSTGGPGLKFGGNALSITATACTCPQSLALGNYVIESNSAYPNQPSINLWVPRALINLPPAGAACIFGNYIPMPPGQAQQLCQIINPNGTTPPCVPSPMASQLIGLATYIQPTGAGFSAAACQK